MSTLLLRLVGPLQAWGTDGRFSVRGTDRQPSKSGIVGLLAAAQGRRRTDPIEDLAGLRIAVRTDQPGRIARDFHTARTRDGRTSLPLSQRYYLEDAVFVVGVEGEADLVASLAEAIQAPRFPVFLGRKSCSPSAPLLIEVSDEPLHKAIRDVPWQASTQHAKKTKAVRVRLDVLSDTEGEADGYVQDHPVSFNPEQRQYLTRAVQRSEVLVANPHATSATKHRQPFVHDPFEGLA